MKLLYDNNLVLWNLAVINVYAKMGLGWLINDRPCRHSVSDQKWVTEENG
jgi:hypothetical protein